MEGNEPPKYDRNMLHDEVSNPRDQAKLVLTNIEQVYGYQLTEGSLEHTIRQIEADFKNHDLPTDGAYIERRNLLQWASHREKRRRWA